MVAPTGLTISTAPPRSPSFSQPGSTPTRRRLSVFQPISSSRIGDEKLRVPVGDHVVLLLQEWLTIVKFPATLRCLLDEYARELKQTPPAMDKWFEMTQQLDLQAIPTHDSLANPALLERIVEQTFAKARHRKELTKQTAPVLVSSKRPLTASATLKFASKRSLPMSSAIVASKSTSALPGSPAFRPKSAAVVPSSSKSTSDLLQHTDKALTKLTRLNESSATSTNGVTSNNQTTSSPKKESLLRRGGSRPISAAPGSLTPHQDSQPGSVRKPSSAAASSSSLGARASVSGQASPTQKRSSRLLTLKSPSSLKLLTTRQETSSDAPEAQEANDKGDRPEEEDNAEAAAAQATPEFQPVMELEDMNEERLTEHFGAFSKGTIKKLRRVLAKSSAHSQDMQRTRKAMEKIKLRAQQQHDRSAFAAQQTDLLSLTMDSLTKEPCSLCRYVFLKKNLTTKVSNKSICDLRAHWAATKREQLEANGLAPPETEDGEVGRLGDDELLINQQAQVQPLESAQQISHFYDEVPVCVFCAQLALDFSSYRPTSAQQKQRKEEKRRLALEQHKQREVQRQRDKLKCDPLDFHAYELNSDDEEGGESETEEVLEVDADGRVRVVRRRRRRRRTARTPAQTGFVSKKIHYDHLRSQSVHALNRKEWEVISQQQQPS